jgi:hypothetical protein
MNEQKRILKGTNLEINYDKELVRLNKTMGNQNILGLLVTKNTELGKTSSSLRSKKRRRYISLTQKVMVHKSDSVDNEKRKSKEGRKTFKGIHRKSQSMKLTSSFGLKLEQRPPANNFKSWKKNAKIHVDEKIHKKKILKKSQGPHLVLDYDNLRNLINEDLRDEIPYDHKVMDYQEAYILIRVKFYLIYKVN